MRTPADQEFVAKLQAAISNYQQTLPGEFPDFKLYVFESLASTMDEASQLAKENRFAAVLAREQTKGRGREERVWHSAKDSGLYVTYLLSADDVLESVSSFSLVTAACVISLLRKLVPKRAEDIRLKWPNDILVGDRGTGSFKKLAGILLQSTERASLLVGIGLNLRRSEELSQLGGISLEDLGVTYALEDIFAQVTFRLFDEFQNFASQGFSPFLSEIRELSMMNGAWVKSVVDNEEKRLLARDIAEDGSLLVCDPETDNELRVYSGEVSLVELP